jgi:hypothetical protein
MESVTKILFVDSGMSEGDLKILNKLSDFLTGKNSSKGHKFKVIYRTHPKIQISADRQFFLDSIADLPNIEVFQPNVNESNFDRISQLSDAKIVISIFSTYILEGSILNKTCIIPTFWVGFQNHSPTKLIDDISHFHGMSLLDGINIASSFSELINLIEGYTKEIKCSNELRLLKWFCEDLNTRNEITNLVNKYI